MPLQLSDVVIAVGVFTIIEHCPTAPSIEDHQDTRHRHETPHITTFASHPNFLWIMASQSSITSFYHRSLNARLSAATKETHNKASGMNTAVSPTFLSPCIFSDHKLYPFLPVNLIQKSTIQTSSPTLQESNN